MAQFCGKKTTHPCNVPVTDNPVAFNLTDSHHFHPFHHLDLVDKLKCWRFSFYEAYILRAILRSEAVAAPIAVHCTASLHAISKKCVNDHHYHYYHCTCRFATFHCIHPSCRSFVNCPVRIRCHYAMHILSTVKHLLPTFPQHKICM